MTTPFDPATTPDNDNLLGLESEAPQGTADDDASGTEPAAPQGTADDDALGMESPSPLQLLEALRRQLTQENPGSCRRFRRHERIRCQIPIALDIVAADSGRPLLQRRARMVDVSASGLSFLFEQEIPLGTHLHVHFDSLRQDPRLRAIVRHCTHINGTELYRIGAEFCEPGAARSSPPGSPPL